MGWSGFKIHPGRGKTLVRTNSQTFVLISKKVEAQFKNKTNPRKCPWTKIYRTVNKKELENKKKSSKLLLDFLLKTSNVKEKMKLKQHLEMQLLEKEKKKLKVKVEENKIIKTNQTKLKIKKVLEKADKYIKCSYYFIVFFICNNKIFNENSSFHKNTKKKNNTHLFANLLYYCKFHG